MATQEEVDGLPYRIEAYRCKLRHLYGPVNDAEKAELESEFVEILRVTREQAAADA
jgi:hypothetical protein